ncbi:hypothetical protein CB1_001891023 [Camelus ferus]|nr:hypothetical protein CB1_001891023 [Camelus ferus]
MSQAAAHYKGTKHAKKLKALEAMKNKQKSVTAKDSVKTAFTSITTNTINTSSDKTVFLSGLSEHQQWKRPDHELWRSREKPGRSWEEHVFAGGKQACAKSKTVTLDGQQAENWDNRKDV